MKKAADFSTRLPKPQRAYPISTMQKAIDFFTAHPARFFLLAALLWGGFMCFLNYKDGANFSWHDLLVEANALTNKVC